VYTIALAAGVAQHPDVDLHLAVRCDDAARWSRLAPSATVHAVVPNGRPARIVWEQYAAPRLARRAGIDVWHGPHYTMPLRLDRPTVVTVHDLTFFDHPEWHERTKVPFFRAMIRASARRAAGVVCISQYTADRLAAVAPAHGTVVVARHGVDPDRFRPDGDDVADAARLVGHGVTPPFVAFVGTIEPRKNLPNVVAAFARLVPDHPDLRLVLAGGDGWGALALREAVAASGVATHVLRPGYVEDDVVPALFRRASCAVYVPFEEGFGVPALEAMACGAPLVTARGSALAEVAGDAALAVDPSDVDALAAAMRSIVDDSAVASRLRAAGPVRAGTFSWAQSIETHVELYDKVTHEHATR
jgi:glycosyltransferase involved in cell wall biosynthesis